MGIECENGGYKYKAFFNGEWYDLTLSDEPNELTEWLKSNEEWARVKHGHWEYKGFDPVRCSVCGITVDAINGIPWAIKSFNYCPHCGAKMDEVGYE